MSIENVQRIASLFGLAAEPPAVEVDGSGVWQVAAASPPPAAGAIAPELVLAAEGLGTTPAEALAAYQRALVLRAALALPAIRNARARAHAFVLVADAVDAAIGAELSPPEV